MERTKYTPKRLLSLLLALIMLFGMFPTAVFAADGDTPITLTTTPHNDEADIEFDALHWTNNNAQIGFAYSINTIGGKEEETNTVTLLFDGFTPGTNNVKGANLNMNLRIKSAPYRIGLICALSESSATVGNTTTTKNSQVSDVRDWTFNGVEAVVGEDGTASFSVKVQAKFTKAVDRVNFADETLTIEKTVTIKNLFPTADHYSITYNMNDGSNTVHSTEYVPKENRGATRPADPTRAGCIFGGWYEDKDCTPGKEANFGAQITKDTTFYAKWTAVAQTHTVSFVADVTGVSQMPDAIIVEHDKTIPADKVPTVPPIREGYKFLHWTDNLTTKTVYNFAQTITADVKLYPVWEREKVNITWTNNNTTGATWTQPATSEVDLNSTVNFTLTLDEGYELPTVTAGGSPLAATVGATTTTGGKKTTTYHYSFVANAEKDADDNRTMTVTVGETKLRKVTIALPTGDGFRATFTGCTGTARKANGRTSYTFNYGEEFQISLKADPNVTAYLLTSDDDATSHLKVTNGTTSCADKQGTHTHKATDDFQVDGYADTTYFYRVEYVMIQQGGLYVSQSVQAGQSIATAPAEPNIDGYEFKGWYKDPLCTAGQEWIFASDATTENGKTATTVDHDNTIIYGKFEAKKYTVTYNPNVPKDANNEPVGTVTAGTMPTAGKDNKTHKTHGEVYTISDLTPELTGYDFKGWATSPDGPVAYQPGGQITADATQTLYAVWAKKTYTVTVSSGAGYSTVPAGINTVEWNDNFTFTVTVDREYAATAPKVEYQTKEGTWQEIANSNAADVTKPHWVSGTTSNNSAAAWVYTIPNVQTDYTVTINVARNAIHQVSYFVAKSANAGGTGAEKESTAFLIQSVEHGYYASMPAAPEVSGYKFHHWERYNGNTKAPGGDNAVFAEAITTDDVAFWAVYVPIVPTITIVNKNNICKGTPPHDHPNGFGLENWKHGKDDEPQADATIDTNGKFNIAYGDSVAFDLVIDKGYDYSQLSVTANGLSMGLGDSITLNDDDSTTIHYVLNHVTGDTRISVANIQRKTITINYFANAGDDVAQVPGPQTGVKYYIEGATNDTISSFEPKRNGYTFLGWCEVPNGTLKFDETTGKTLEYVELKDGTKYKVYQPGDTTAFEKDTNLYAIWEAAELKVKLVITDEFVTSDNSTSISEDKILEYAYEGDKIYLVGKLSENAQGTMTFYKRHRGDDDNKWSYIGSVVVNGGKYGVLETAAEPYEWGMAGATSANNHFWEYKVEFVPTNEEGYTSCEGKDDLRVYSKAISWKLNGQDPAKTAWTLATDARKLTVYEGSIAVANKVDNGVMVANKTYWLQIPQVFEMDGGMTLKQVNEGKTGRYVLIPGTDYTVQWEYQDEKGAWQEYGSRENSDSVKVTPEFSGYVFRAKVYPADASIYKKAAKYNNAEVVKNQYEDWLETLPTAKTALEKTEITLEVNTDDEPNAVVINGTKPFIDKGFAQNDTHKAQYEHQTIDLVAKVTKTDTDKTAISMGTVAFYRYVGKDSNDKDIWEEIGTVDVQPNGENTGVAVFTYTMPGYDVGTQTAPTPVTENVETFKAVYLENATYAKSSAEGAKAYIKSAKLQTPVIMDADKPTAHEGKWLNDQDQAVSNGDKKTETTYNYHLGGLMAGIPHTFELKTGAASEAYSVVALDGRAVPADMYTMKWWTLTNANWNETTTNGDTYTAETTKVGDRYHILLTGAKNSPFEGSEAVSKDIAIGELQGVVVTVEAIDAITKTDETDVYQLNDIELTAKVEAADDENADRKPTGYVGFYYYDDKAETGNDPYVWLGKAKLEEIDGEMIATIKTNKLPVDPDDNTRRNVKITAVYFGDETFEASENWGLKDGSTTEWEVKATDIPNKVKSDIVTVYSSVVYNCGDENKKLEACGEKGIHIKVEDGVFKANEKNVVLKLSDIYTLDRGLDKNLLDIIAKLTPGMDYTIQWQKLNNANAFSDKDGANFTESKHWQDITDATGVTVVLGTVEQNTAYRAVITVKDQPITKGSYSEVKQVVKGRQVYYSNILMPTDASITMSVMVNTDKNGKNLEGITEGETVTANVFLSGVTGSVPNAEIEVCIEADATKGNGNNYAKSFTKATVNGWNSIDWDTKDVAPGFYTMKITAKTNTGYATKIFERSIIVRESSYDFNIGNRTTTYNGQTQGVTVTLNGFDFKGRDINEAAKKSWTVKYYDKDGKLVEPSQAGTYKAVVTLPGSAYWTEHSETVDFTISKRSVGIADAVAQAKVYDNSTDVNIVEVILNDAVTDQGNTGLPTTNGTGIINGDSVYAVATKAALNNKNAGNNSFTIDSIQLLGDDAANYVWDGAVYTEPIYVSRSQVYGEIPTYLEKDISLKISKDEKDPVAKVNAAIKMIDQSGRRIDFTTKPSEDTEDYTLTFYYHSDTEIKQTNDLSKTGLYTVVARPKQDNYKGGVTMKFEVIDGETTYTPAAEPKPSTLITISNTAELYGEATGAVAKNTKGETVKVEYQNGTGWSTTIPENAGRYLVRATDTNTGDVAYGIYTITKAHPSISITAAKATYNSMPYTGAATDLTKATENPEHYLTYAGDVAIGYYATEADQKNGNVAEQAPVDAGDYVVTLHVNETQNYTAHEVSAPFTIAKKALTIKADSRKTTQYDAFPTMTATYDGLAAETNDGTPDTSLRDVQIAPEFIYNPTNDKPNYSNAALDQVGRVAVQPIDALAKNYKLSYGDGEYVKSETESNPDLEILGLPQSGEKDGTGNKYVAKVYYGDKVQLYPYGNYAAWANYSSEFKWEITGENRTNSHGYFEITDDGVLKVEAIGSFTVKLTRGEGEQEISTTVEVTALRKEAKIALKEVDKVYNGEDQTYAFENITVHDDLYREITPFGEGKLNRTKLSRKNIGTQIPTATVNTSTTGSWYYQSETYGGQFTINDKEATVAPGAQSTVYGTTEKYEDEKWTVTGEANGVKAVDNVNVASQTDVYDRLDVYDGYEILVAGTEDINYNVKYTTDPTAQDSKVTEYTDVVFKSMTRRDLNDATVYGETPNALDWTLMNAQSTTRGAGSDTKPYTDNLADFNLPEIFVYQVYDNCIGNADCGKFDYKAANRTTVAKPLAYNQVVLSGLRHSEPNTLFETLITLNNNPAHDEGNGEHPNYTLFFNSNAASGVSKGVKNYSMKDQKFGNNTDTTSALSGSKGYVKNASEDLVTRENFVEGSANIAQRPVKVEKDTNLGTVTLYWKLPQKDLYTALLNILKAEATSNGRGLAKGHTIEDLDLIFTIGTETVSKTSTEPMNFPQAGQKTVTLTIGDTNYVLDGDRKFEVVFETMRIRAYYYNKTFTGFNVRIQKIGANSEPAGPLTSTKGLTFKVLKEVNGVLDPNTDYATNKVLKFNSADGTYGYFTGTYDELPLLGAGELYVFQLYEYGVPLERK